MFIRVKNALISVEDIRSVEAGVCSKSNIFEPERNKTALVIRFCNVEDPLYILCDSVEERDALFEKIVSRVEVEIIG
ncbi:MAG: hypothetical protein IK130_02555 [Oscillospiraceae bacterium]|nr:hypothetical protein [Oscillospiraceae bacterium]